MKRYRLTVLCSVIFCILMIAFPSLCVEGSKQALFLWGQTVVPALLPFFICANFMIATGVPNILGRFLEPLIKRIFCVPGEAAFAFVMSITSGYPMGAKIVADLRSNHVFTRAQAERTITFACTSGPLFMLGAVGAGMLLSPKAGWVIALSHYTGAIINGLFYGRLIREDGKSLSDRSRNTVPMKQNTMEILNHAILDSVKSLIMIGGFMLIFLIGITFFKAAGLFDYPLFHGFLEMTIGCSEVAALKGISIGTVCMMCTAIISWGGLSVQAQSLSFLSKTDIRPWVYFMSRATHMIFAAAATVPFSYLFLEEVTETWVGNAGDLVASGSLFIYDLLFSSGMVIMTISVFFILSIISAVLNDEKKRQEEKETNE